MQTQKIFDLFLDLLPFLIPIFIIQFGLVIYALIDLAKRDQVKGGKALWAILLLFLLFTVPSGMIGAAVYLVWGRNVEVIHDSH